MEEEPILDYYKSYFSPVEIDVAGILLQLPGIVAGLGTRIRHSVRWGRKKRRSAVSCKRKSTMLRFRLPAATSASRPNNPGVNPEVNAVKDESNSPTTPLLFDPEETPPPPPLRSRVVSGKRKIVLEDWQEVDGLKKQKQLLQKEIQKVEEHKERLINDNRVLQSRKQQLERQRSIQEEVQLQIQKQSSSLDTQLGQASNVPSSVVMFAGAFVQQEHSHHQQIVPHLYQTTMTVQTAQIQSAVIGENQSCRASETQMTSTSLSCDSVKASGVTLVSCNNNRGLVRVADCGYSYPHQNQSSSLPTPDLYKAMMKAQCAQKRQERYQKNRVKKTSHLGQK